MPHNNPNTTLHRLYSLLTVFDIKKSICVGNRRKPYTFLPLISQLFETLQPPYLFLAIHPHHHRFLFCAVCATLHLASLSRPALLSSHP